MWYCSHGDYFWGWQAWHDSCFPDSFGGGSKVRSEAFWSHCLQHPAVSIVHLLERAKTNLCFLPGKAVFPLPCSWDMNFRIVANKGCLRCLTLSHEDVEYIRVHMSYMRDDGCAIMTVVKRDSRYRPMVVAEVTQHGTDQGNAFRTRDFPPKRIPHLWNLLLRSCVCACKTAGETVRHFMHAQRHDNMASEHSGVNFLCSLTGDCVHLLGTKTDVLDFVVFCSCFVYRSVHDASKWKKAGHGHDSACKLGICDVSCVSLAWENALMLTFVRRW